MSPMMLHERHPIHRPDEQRHVDHPVMERRFVGVGGKSEDHGAANGCLNQLLHGVILGGPPSICSLRFPVRPAAVFGAVRSAVVDPIQSHAAWPFSHVGKEIRVVLPALTDRNASAAIVPVGVMVGVSASLPHATPQAVCGISAKPMSRVPSGRLLRVEATTGRGVPSPQVAAIDIELCPTNAHAAPPDAVLFSPFTLLKDGQSTENDASQIKLSHPKIVGANARGCNG